MIRTAAILQLLLGNVGRPGGGITEMRGPCFRPYDGGAGKLLRRMVEGDELLAEWDRSDLASVEVAEIVLTTAMGGG